MTDTAGQQSRDPVPLVITQAVASHPSAPSSLTAYESYFPAVGNPIIDDTPYLVWHGLRRYGFLAEAGELAEKGFALFMASWRERRIAAENYNAATGEALDQGDADPFYIWAALLPAMAVGEITDVDPWAGWTLANRGREGRLGPFLSPAGAVTVSAAGGTVTLERAGEALLATNIDGRLAHLAIEPHRVAFRVERRRPGGTIRLPSTAPSRVVALHVDGAAVSWSSPAGSLEIDLPVSALAADVTVHLR